jgi:hypothetical protein
MPGTPAGDTRLLVLVNPGRTSRNYMVGVARAARTLGLLGGTVEMGEVWEHLRRAGGGVGAARAEAARAEAARAVADLCARERITHAVSYIHNGVFEFGLHAGAGGPSPLFPSIGVRHIMLWTDHPEWAVGGTPLDPQARAALAHPMHTHILKSRGAAEELRAVCAWPNIFSSPMGEDPDALRPVREHAPVHDAVMILSDASAPARALEPFLECADPDPGELMQAMRPCAVRAWTAFVASGAPDGGLRDELHRLGAAWLDARAERPMLSFHRLSAGLAHRHAGALAWLRAEPQRWYGATAALRTITAWRRSFWPAWLARRADLGVYGSDPALLSAAGGGAAWVPYDEQAAVYARGRCALSINAAHDEEGLTHKPFQMAASGAAMVHHATLGLDECFEPGEEVFVFERGPELLETVRSLAGDEGRRRRTGDRARERFLREHTWTARLPALLALDGAARGGAGLGTAA